jgi:transcriptional regulator with XRE-family HTH domain
MLPDSPSEDKVNYSQKATRLQLRFSENSHCEDSDFPFFLLSTKKAAITPCDLRNQDNSAARNLSALVGSGYVCYEFGNLAAMAEQRSGNFLESPAVAAGRRLRDVRERLGLTLRSVEEASAQLASAFNNIEFSVPPSRLSDIETKGVLPSIYRLQSLSIIYRVSWDEVLSWYGIELMAKVPDLELLSAPKTHLIQGRSIPEEIRLPLRFDPSLDFSKTANLGMFIQKWGVLPTTYLTSFASDNFSYGFIGSQDYTMYPILPPGSFIQIDPAKSRVRKALWRSDYERPIYFLETREESLCGWCSIRDGKIILQPHPMSPAEIRIMRWPQEAEVIGQVVGAAVRLGGE